MVSPKQTKRADKDADEANGIQSQSKKSDVPKQNPDIILKEQVELYPQTHTLWTNSIADLSSEPLLIHMKKVQNSFTAFRNLPVETKREFRGKLFSPLLKTQTLQVVCDIIVLGLEGNTYCKATSDTMKKCQEAMMSECLHIVSNFTELSMKCSQVVVDHCRLLPMLVEKLNEWYTPHVKGKLLDPEEKYIRRSLEVLFQVSDCGSHTNYLRDISNFISVIRKYLSSKVEGSRLRATATLANVANEAEAKDFAMDKGIVRFLLDQLRQSFTKSGSSSSWTQNGLFNVVKNMARFDANKPLLVKEGVLPLLEKGLNPEFPKSPTSKKCFLDSLWLLSFDSQNRVEIKKMETLLQFVVDIYREGRTSDCFVPAEGILYQLRNDLPMKYRCGGIEKMLQDESEMKTKLSADQVQHVMISYETQYQPVVKMICEFLQQNGVKMWMDIYNISEGTESTLQTIAEAVEGARVVLMCVSESYKNSAFCRQEAQYAFERHKPIIPLKVQRDYRPDGWLGLLQGSKYYYDFAQDDPENTKTKKSQLYDAIRKIYEADDVRCKTT